MLMPKRVKYRKQMRGRMRGKAQRGAETGIVGVGAGQAHQQGVFPPGEVVRVIVSIGKDLI